MSSDFNETSGSKLLRKSRENPMFPIGIAGFLCVVAYGGYKYKNRGSMSTSIFLIQLRVAAQGTVIGCLCAGVGYTLFKEHVLKRLESKKTD